MLPDITMKPDQKNPNNGLWYTFYMYIKMYFVEIYSSPFCPMPPPREGHLSPISKTPTAWCHRLSQIQIPQKRACLMWPSSLPSGWTTSSSEGYTAPRNLKRQWTFIFCYIDINRYFRRTFFLIHGFVINHATGKTLGELCGSSKCRLTSLCSKKKKIHYFHSSNLGTCNSW